MEQDEGPSILEYFSVVWKSKWLFLLVSLAVLCIGIYVILKIPIIYRSTGVIQVEQQEIPEQWVNTTVSSAAADRIQAIGQRVLTTSNLSAIIEKFELFKNIRGSLSLEQMVSITRNNFTVEPIQSTSRRGVVAFRISYDDQSPEIALSVTKELVDLYLSENLRSRKQSVTDTRRFLEEEANRIEKQLAVIEERISKFKKTHQGALPEFQEINLQTYERVEQQIGDIDRSLRSLEERRTVLETSLDSTLRLLTIESTGTGEATVTDPTTQRLAELRPEYASLKTRYSKVHPDVIKIQREIKSLEEQVAARATNQQTTVTEDIISPVEDTSSIRLRNDLSASIIEQRSLRNRKSELVVKLSDLEKRINKSPEVEQEYRALIRNHENLQTKYNDIRNKQNSARVSESLEAEQKSERFTLIEPPRLARYPHSPNHKKLLVMAAGAAFLSGLGTILGLNLLDSRIRSINNVSAITNVPVLTTVGYIQSKQDRRRRLHKILLFILLVVAIFIAGYYLIDNYHINFEDIVPVEVLDNARDVLSKLGLLR